MAEQEQKELSMDEILASIRNILHESNAVTPQPYLQEEEIFDLSPSMIVKQEAVPTIKVVEEVVVKDHTAAKKAQAVVADHDDMIKTAEKISNDVSAEIIGSFSELFEQKNTSNNCDECSFDANKLIEQIVFNAVSAKISNELIYKIVKDKIIPVLNDWLKLYLPKMIEQEIQRVMVKVGKD